MLELKDLLAKVNQDSVEETKIKYNQCLKKEEIEQLCYQYGYCQFCVKQDVQNLKNETDGIYSAEIIYLATTDNIEEKYNENIMSAIMDLRKSYQEYKELRLKINELGLLWILD